MSPDRETVIPQPAVAADRHAPSEGVRLRFAQALAPNSASATSPIDVGALEEYWSMMALKILELFYDRVPSELDQITEFVESDDFSGVPGFAHALKGGASYVHALRVVSIAAELESADERTKKQIAHLLHQLRDELERCLDYVPEARRLLSTNPNADEGKDGK